MLNFAFELARKTPRKHLTSATKSNGISITMPYWDERVEAMAKNYPDIKWDKYHIDILTALFVLKPDWFDVVVGSNLFGDILSRPRAGLHRHDRHRAVGQHQPGAEIPVGVRAGARLGARHRRAGASPTRSARSGRGAMMLEHLGEPEAAGAIVSAIEKALAEPKSRTRDLGGNADTTAPARPSPACSGEPRIATSTSKETHEPARSAPPSPTTRAPGRSSTAA